MKQDTLNSLVIAGATLAYIVTIILVLYVTRERKKPATSEGADIEALKAELREKNERIRELRGDLGIFKTEHHSLAIRLHEATGRIAKYETENRMQAEEIQRLRDELAAARGTEQLAPAAG